MTGIVFFSSMVDVLLIGIIGSVLVFFFTVLILQPMRTWLQNKGKVGVDVHKPSKPVIPEMGGIGALIGLEIMATDAFE